MNQTTTDRYFLMKPQKESLRKQELEVQRLMRQMMFDQLEKSQVYRKLEQEMAKIKAQKQSLELVDNK